MCKTNFHLFSGQFPQLGWSSSSQSHCCTFAHTVHPVWIKLLLLHLLKSLIFPWPMSFRLLQLTHKSRSQNSYNSYSLWPCIHPLIPILHCFLNFSSDHVYWILQNREFFTFLLYPSWHQLRINKWLSTTCCLLEYFNASFNLIKNPKPVISQTLFSYNAGYQLVPHSMSPNQTTSKTKFNLI